MVSKINSVGIFGMESYMVQVETDNNSKYSNSYMNIVGLPDVVVKESKDRVLSAMNSMGLKVPTGRIITNLAPADVKKIGSLYDLPILISIYMSANNCLYNLSDSAFIGELSLDGTLRPNAGMLPMAICAKENGIKKFYVPYENAAECSVVEGIEIYPVHSATEIIDFLNDGAPLDTAPVIDFNSVEFDNMPDFSEVKGQQKAKKAMEIAAAGGHNVLLIGPPGSGKSMLAKRLPSILPPLSFEEALDTSKIHSIAGLLSSKQPIIKVRPFRSPHHNVSAAGLTGGGTVPKPGEISLAHNGVLFMDELPEFDRKSLETLRQPLEDGVITISRVAGTSTYPCSIALIGAMNPCACGNYGNPKKKCTCTETAVRKYLGRISGPLLDRLDLQVEVPAVDFNSLKSKSAEESSESIRKRVVEARLIQQKRFEGTGITCNARITSKYLNEFCALTDDAEDLLKEAFDALGLSGRGYDRILKVSRTIADLDGSEKIDDSHIAEALQFRSLDRKYFN